MILLIISVSALSYYRDARSPRRQRNNNENFCNPQLCLKYEIAQAIEIGLLSARADQPLKLSFS